ncbi:MAG: acetyl-CoA carboxylase biotin carboxyl carrier protein, partial [Pseudomonadota bacterium]
AAILREADLGEIEVEHNDLRVRVSKPTAPAVSVSAPAVAAPIAAPAPAAAPAAPEAAAPETSTPTGADHPGAVKSPMVGTAYFSPEPGAAAFISEGDTVKEGQTLLLVEAMKTFNPVAAPKAGKVVKILIDDAQPVEFGEALVIIE